MASKATSLPQNKVAQGTSTSWRRYTPSTGSRNSILQLQGCSSRSGCGCGSSSSSRSSNNKERGARNSPNLTETVTDPPQEDNVLVERILLLAEKLIELQTVSSSSKFRGSPQQERILIRSTFTKITNTASKPENTLSKSRGSPPTGED